MCRDTSKHPPKGPNLGNQKNVRAEGGKCVLCSSKLFLLLLKPSVLSLNQSFRESSQQIRCLEEYQKSGGKRPYNSSILILVLLCNVIKEFSLYIDSAFSIALQNYQDKFLFSHLFLVLQVHRPLSTAGSCLHGMFKVLQEACVSPLA